jgi:hypothetical protein
LFAAAESQRKAVGRDREQPTPSANLDGTAVTKVSALLAIAIIGVKPPRSSE